MSAKSLGPRLRHTAQDAWQVLRGVFGERAYENYVAHHTAHHPPDEPPMSEREFWRRQGDREPPARCC